MKLPLIWIFSIIRPMSQIKSIIIGRWNELCWTEAFSYFGMKIRMMALFNAIIWCLHFMPSFALAPYHCYCAAHPKQSDQNEMDVFKVTFFSLDLIALDRAQIRVIKSLDNMLSSKQIFSNITDFPTTRSIYSREFIDSIILIFHYCGSSRFKTLNWLSTFLTEKLKLDYC